MNLKHRLFRLSRLSPKTIPRVVARRLASTGRSAKERLLYRPTGPRRAAPPRKLTPLGLLHPDVRAAGFAERFRAAHLAETGHLIHAADRAARLEFDLLGSGPVDLAALKERSDLRLYPDEASPKAAKLAARGKVPWHFDFKSGVGWPSDTFFSDVAYGAPGVDIKVPWELSRCAHFVTFGQAYALTRDERYTAAFCEQLEDWIRSNPPKYGVNWACPMDVALRAANWILAWEFFADSAAVTPFVKEHLPGSLWEHGKHIVDHLEFGGELSSNHYLSDLLGLAYIGQALDEEAWWTLANRELSAQLLNQTHEDGLDFEGSTAYHRLVLEIFFFHAMAVTAVAGKGGRRAEALSAALGPAHAERFARMGSALAAILDGEGRAPFIGDNDSGRVHVFGRRPDADMAYLADFMTLFLADERLRLKRPGAPEAVWLFGLEATANLANAGVPPAALPSLTGTASGLATLRGPRDLLIFCAQPNGTRGVGNHTHNDKLSFCLSVGADVFLTDPGTFVYTSHPAERDAFRATSAHSTVQVDDAEQNRIIPGQLFVLGDDATVTVSGYKEGRRVSASHDGYARLHEGVVHRRSIERIDQPLSWIIEDELEGQGVHDLRWRFVCGAGLRVETGPNGTVRLYGSEGRLELSSHPATLRFELREGRVAPAYGLATPAPVVTCHWRGRLPTRATFTAVWEPAGPGVR